MSTKPASTSEGISQKVTSILIGAALAAYAVVFVVRGVGPYIA
jgi:hypothetical protein